MYSEVERCLSCQRYVKKGYNVGQPVSRYGKAWGEGVHFKSNPLSVGIEGEEDVATDVLEKATPVSIDTDHARLGAAMSHYSGDQAISVEGYSRASPAVFRVTENGNRKETDSVSILVSSSGRHRDAGPSSVSEIHAGGYPALAKRRFGRSVFDLGCCR